MAWRTHLFGTCHAAQTRSEPSHNRTIAAQILHVTGGAECGGACESRKRVRRTISGHQEDQARRRPPRHRRAARVRRLGRRARRRFRCHIIDVVVFAGVALAVMIPTRTAALVASPLSSRGARRRRARNQLAGARASAVVLSGASTCAPRRRRGGRGAQQQPQRRRQRRGRGRRRRPTVPLGRARAAPRAARGRRPGH